MAEEKMPSILLVDDDESARNTIAELLVEEGFDIDIAPSGPEALALLEQKAYDLIISDLVMPKMDGIRLTENIKSLGITTPIVVITGFATIEHAVATMKAGAFDFITKPFNFDQIKITVQKALETQRLKKLAQEREFYKNLSNKDELTSLANYRSLTETLQTEIDRALRYERPLSVMMVDIDDFKNWNDNFGHLVGDMLLRKISVLIKKNTRGSDFVARYGGEEFFVVLPETTIDEALFVAERMREAINKHAFTADDGTPLGHLSVTVGLSSLPGKATNKNDLIRTADEALYEGKAAGKNRVIVYSNSNQSRKE